MNKFENLEWRSVALFRIAGYGLLILACFDFFNIFIPPRFTNPVWEFQMLGELVEKMPVPLIGLVFVFYGKEEFRKDIEEYILKALSWASLVFGILFLLLIPLGITNTIRINNLNNFQINAQLSQRITQLQQLNDQLISAGTDEDINRILTQLNFQGRPPEIRNYQEFKNKIISDIPTAQKQIQANLENTRQSQKINLIKNSVKWNLGAIISGALFIYIWRLTNWAR